MPSPYGQDAAYKKKCIQMQNQDLLGQLTTICQTINREKEAHICTA